MQKRITTILALIVIVFTPLQTASAFRAAGVTDDQLTLDFPNNITFHAKITSSSKITSVVLEYGDQEETCGQVIAEAYPQITPSTSVNVEWTWDMRQSGSLPPGTQIWWRWRYTDETGHESISDQKTITWLDNVHKWQTVTKGDIHLHWYKNDSSFAQDLLDNAVNGLARIEKDAGLTADQPIDLYIYASTDDMKDAILYEPSWTGGQAFPEHNIVIIGISPSDLTWGRRAEVHELTHVLVGHLTFTCLGDVPTWLNEGLAVYSEGPLDEQSQQQLDDAIKNDTLLSVRSLSGGFSEVSDKAYLSYSESESIVGFLIKTHGREQMTALLIDLRDGNTIDEALNQVYGFNVEGLEDAWRKSIAAAPRAVEAQPTAVVTPTFVPTIVPVSGAPLAITPTPFNFPTPIQTDNLSGGPPLSLTLILLFTCCAIFLVLGAIVIAVIVAMQRGKGGNNEKKS
ncbi:MAG TPA: peptidase MA family metallohydrolase [Anaerolineales bacterium]|nr:peptidase MA family metallohydrolase [Anaerolineales bacterium]